MVSISHRFVDTNGIRMHIAEAGEGPLVVLCHGFPELGYSWRHQLEALAAAGYHAVAPDQRGYGQTAAPGDIHQYTLLHLAGDIVGLVQALGADRCVVVGHDWGSPVASTVGLFRPDLVRGVALLSVPYLPRGDSDQLTALTELLGPHNYQVFFQEPGVAEAALEADVRTSMVGSLIGGSGDAPEVNTLSDLSAGDMFANVATDPLPGGDVDVAAMTTALVAAGASVVGRMIGYAIGRNFGYWLLLRYGGYVGITETRIKLGQYLFLRHGGKIIVIAQFIPVLRTLAGILAGANRMPRSTFMMTNILGASLWASFFGIAAYTLGRQVERLAGSVVFVCALGVIAALILAAIFVKGHEAQLAAEAERALPGPLELP